MVIGFLAMSVAHADQKACYVAYAGCDQLHSACMPLLTTARAVKDKIIQVFHSDGSGNPQVMLICSGWKKWVKIQNVTEAQFSGISELFNLYARHWYRETEQGKLEGPLSREQLRTTAGFTEDTKVWSGVRMGQDGKPKRAGDVLELLQSVFNSDDEIIL